MDNTITVNMENLTPDERKQLISLVEKSNKPSLKQSWRAEENNIYYYISSNLTIETDREAYFAIDNQRYRIGNYFKTEEEAKFEKEKILVYQELRNYALKYNDSDFDWSNKRQYKYYIFCSNKEVLVGSHNVAMHLGQIYFTSREIAQNAVATIGEDRIKKYLFGIE